MEKDLFTGIQKPQRVELFAGPLTATFEPESGCLRYICLGDREVLRGIYVAVRDHNWGTVMPVIGNLSIKAGEDSFACAFQATCRAGAIDFIWDGEITGTSDGTVRYSMNGRARSTFRRNRIGFCILHSAHECRGAACRVEMTGRRMIDGRFPDLIAPHQPFKEMTAISHEVQPGVMASVRFEGDIFEMEDQRNWSDASYKTYCTPLSQPFPVEVPQGSVIRQSVTLSVTGTAAAPLRTRADEVTVTVEPANGSMLPQLGLGCASHGQALSPRETELFSALKLHHLRLDLDLSRPAFAASLKQAAAEASAMGARLEASVHVTDDATGELRALREQLDTLQPPVCRWLILHKSEKTTSARWVRMAREILGTYDPRIPIGAGTNSYFTELNRNRPPVDDCDLVFFSVNPQVHAFDNASLVETLPMHSIIVESARAFAGSRSVCVTPVTLRKRFNPDATSAPASLGQDALPDHVDVRQSTLFTACWTLGSIKYLAAAGTAGVTYFETSGWLGIIEQDQPAAHSDVFPTIPGCVFPVYHVFRLLASYGGGRMYAVQSSQPLAIEAMAVRNGSGKLILLANYSAEAQQITLRDRDLQSGFSVCRYEPETVLQAMTEPEQYRDANTRRVAAGTAVYHMELPACAFCVLEMQIS